jgi:SAM-dependent methyltransferase
MKMILYLGKKILKRFTRLDYIINYSQRATEDFIVKTARKEIKSGSIILDAGAGVLKYKKYFQDCIYKTQDFKQYGQIDYVSDIIDIPVEDKSFDVIICTEVLEHIPRPDLAIKEFSRILRPEGKLYLTSPFLAGIHRAPDNYYSGFSEYWYKKYLKGYGFEILEIREKKGAMAFYAQETLRVLLYVIKSKKWRYKIFTPIAGLLILILVPFYHFLDRSSLKESSYKITVGYLIKAKK